MTQLITKSERDLLGIDTLPRAIIYAVHCLEYVAKDDTNLSGKVGFIQSSGGDGETVSTTFTAQVDLTFDQGEALKAGFKLWENINPLTALDSPDYLAVSPTTPHSYKSPPYRTRRNKYLREIFLLGVFDFVG